MKLEKPRAKYYLGQTGIVGSREDEKSDARELFLKNIERHAPAVLEDLRQKVFDRWTASRDIDTPRPEYVGSVREWAIDWNLTWKGQPADWILGQLECTFSDWVLIPKIVGRYWGTFPGFHEKLPVVELFDISEELMVCRGVSNDSQLVVCMPTTYPRPQIREALRQLQKNVQKVLQHTETDRKFRQYLRRQCALEKARAIDEEHFVWAVRFQCLGHTHARIAASRDSDWIERNRQLDDAKLASATDARPAIAAGIREILKLIEVTPRCGDKIDLPKHK